MANGGFVVSEVKLLQRIVKLEEGLGSSPIFVLILRQLEKLGIRFEVTCKTFN